MKDTFTRQELINKVKEFCNHELDHVGYFGYNPTAALTRSYGAVMFLINIDDFDKDLSDWWNNEMHEKFRQKGVC